MRQEVQDPLVEPRLVDAATREAETEADLATIMQDPVAVKPRLKTSNSDA